jgi:nicotinamide-nucleotide amidase
VEKLQGLVSQLAERLQEKKLLMATAESCTGGLIAAYLTDLPGSSLWFDRGFITYSNLAKQQMLDVNPNLIQHAGAVSEAVARAMANGALKNSAASLALAVTGIAGPDGGSEDKPVGMVCFAWSGKGLVTQSLCRYFSGNRESIRLLACEQAIQGLLQYS